jgi:hypothetical protein
LCDKKSLSQRRRDAEGTLEVGYNRIMDQRGLDDLSWLDDITEADIEAMTAGERIALMWPITVAGYLKQGIDVRNQPFRRDVVKIIRRRPDGTEEVVYSSHGQ